MSIFGLKEIFETASYWLMLAIGFFIVLLTNGVYVALVRYVLLVFPVFSRLWICVSRLFTVLALLWNWILLVHFVNCD